MEKNKNTPRIEFAAKEIREALKGKARTHETCLRITENLYGKNGKVARPGKTAKDHYFKGGRVIGGK